MDGLVRMQIDHLKFPFAFVDVLYERALSYAKQARDGNEGAREMETIFVTIAARILSEVVREVER